MRIMTSSLILRMNNFEFNQDYEKITVLAKGREPKMIIDSNRKSSSWPAGKICHHWLVCDGIFNCLLIFSNIVIFVINICHHHWPFCNGIFDCIMHHFQKYCHQFHDSVICIYWHEELKFKVYVYAAEIFPTVVSTYQHETENDACSPPKTLVSQK